MTLTFTPLPVPLQEDTHGTIRVGGTRVTLETVIYSYRQGDSPEEIASSFDTLKLADIYAVITYYLRHQEEVKAYLRRQEGEAEAIRRKIESQPGYEDLRKRILARAAARRDRPE